MVYFLQAYSSNSVRTLPIRLLIINAQSNLSCLMHANILIYSLFIDRHLFFSLSTVPRAFFPPSLATCISDTKSEVQKEKAEEFTLCFQVWVSGICVFFFLLSDKGYTQQHRLLIWASIAIFTFPAGWNVVCASLAQPTCFHLTRILIIT